ncbi:GntR family transcriptional regulator [Nocardiopsis sp. HUAS JQ3]|uniref:GntR family transcriptional regulator n=1 Tax=Nocardiopsis sp. HUAS JQ3 TaxID=3061629 RepID=UPI0023A9221E|nr:GntR family transcriptional regulator [Nocardiopsis sp. HUAS JQ3]WDZ90352.1 GntR family transcriptional regulator [Nocardiopsis sp. HUAS JQ3]
MVSTTGKKELPPYARVVTDIRARIGSGELRPGERVPSTREIMREWGVAMATATKALAALRQEGLVEAVRGVGTLVRGAPVSAPEPQKPQRQRERPRPARTEDPGSHRPAAETGGLAREAIVRAAITIADAEGIDGLSMRRVATQLGVSTMALYRHVANKDALVTAMIDQVYTEHALPDPPPADWREALELALLTEWGIYRAHPWAVQLTPLAGAVQSPGLVQNAEWMMRVITGQGRSPDEAMAILTFVSAYTSGMALQGTRAVVEGYEAGMDAEHWWRSRGEEFLRIAEQGRFPLTFSVSGPTDVHAIFDLGMKHLLDGLAPLIESGGRPADGGLSGPTGTTR